MTLRYDSERMMTKIDSTAYMKKTQKEYITSCAKTAALTLARLWQHISYRNILVMATY